MTIPETRWLRRLVLPVFARINPGDISIRHHYTGDPLRLHSFRHKGYWFYGKEREADTMLQFASLVNPGDAVFEVGGHIGYISMYLARLAGDSGSIHVFEPGPNNLPYITHNTRNRPNVFVEPLGVGSSCGTLPFYLEELTGQNNSFVRDFAGLRENEASAHVRANRAMVQVEVVTLDDFASHRNIWPNFVKVDVEGFEYEVLKGMSGLLQTKQPRLMVEVQTSESAIFEFLSDFGYFAFDPRGELLTSSDRLKLNTFFIHRQDEAGIAHMRTRSGSGT
jgi:FkbM family methyltransferase